MASLGVTGVWLNPINPSPNLDWGYDVTDYRGVHPDLGTLEDFDALLAEAGRVGLHVLLDLVPNHTSEQHPWFAEARRSPEAPRRDWYVWAPTGPEGAPPNNWRSLFDVPAWSPSEQPGVAYLHNFLPEQPDLNWWNGEVREEFSGIVDFWLRRGVAGFRVDVANALHHDRELRDNPPLEGDEPHDIVKLGQRPTRSLNRPEAVDVHAGWRAQVEAHAGADGVLLGETWAYGYETLGALHAGGRGLHLGCNFPLVKAPFVAAALSEAVERTLEHVPAEWNAWFGTNHDVGRMATRWCAGEPARIRCALTIILSLPGTPILCFGDEIGLQDVEVPRERLRDTVGVRGWPQDTGRDGCRTPMVWEDTPGAGFTAAGVEPWLPIGPTAPANVASQLDDPDSHLALTRALLALRRSREELHAGTFRSLAAPEGCWAFARGEATVVAVNLCEARVEVPELDGSVLLCTDRRRDGEAVEGALSLGPWQAAIVARA